MARAVVGLMVLAGFLFAQAMQTAECAALNRSITQNRKILTVFRNDPPGALNRYLFGGGVFGLFSRPPGKFVMEIEGGGGINGKQDLNWVFSQDLTRYAFINLQTVCEVVLDGKRHKKYWGLSAPRFSPDGISLNYVGQRNRGSGLIARKFDLVLGTETQGPYERAEPPHYSPDGKRRCHAVKEKGRWTLFENGQALPHAYEELTLLGYTDSNRLVMGGMREGKWLVDIDGKTFLQVSKPLSVLEGGPSQVPVVIREGGEKRFIISHGPQESGPYQEIPALLTSPLSEEIAFAAKNKEGKWHFQVGTSLKGPYPDARLLAVTSWTAEGPAWAYGAKVGEGFRLFRPEGDEGGWEDMAGPFVVGMADIVYAYKSGADWYVKFRGETLGPFLQVAYLPQLWQTSPDHKHLAFPARDQEGWSVVVNGVKGPTKGEDLLAIRWIDSSKLRYWMARDPGPTKRNAKVRQAYHFIEEEIR